MGKIAFIGFITVLIIVVSVSVSYAEEQIQEIEEFALSRDVRNAKKGDKKLKRKKTSKRNRRKKKNRKNRKSKNSKKKNQRKGGAKQLKKEKNKKRGGRKNVRTSKNDCSRQTSSTFCPLEVASSLKLLYNQVTNFKKQLKRAQNHAKIVGKKKSKKDNFKKDAAILQDVVGGNFSKPSCPGKSTRTANEAATQGSTLSKCSENIDTSCPDITLNSTLTGACSDTMTSFESKVKTCKETPNDCTCWKEAFAMKSDIAKCNAKDEMNSMKEKKKACLAQFSKCKTAQDSAVEHTATCPSSQNTGVMTTNKAAKRNILQMFLEKNLLKRHQQNLARE